MQQVQTKKVTFKVARAVELAPGLVLPRGLYTGTRTRTRLDSAGGVSWTPSKYKLELATDQLASLSELKSHLKKNRRDEIRAPREIDHTLTPGAFRRLNLYCQWD